MRSSLLSGLFFSSMLLFMIFIFKKFFYRSKVLSENYGTLIFLNGPSSAGKTSIVYALQELMQEPYLRVSIDGFLATMPRRFWGPDAKQAHQGFEWVNTQDDKGPLVIVKVGPWGAKLVAGMYQALAGLVKQGNNVVMDDVMLREEALAQAVQSLAGIRVYFIGVKAPLEVLEQREQARGNRALNMARGQYKVVHELVYKHGSYDFEIDTSLHTPEECARLIKRYVDEHSIPEAFAKLYYALK